LFFDTDLGSDEHYLSCATHVSLDAAWRHVEFLCHRPLDLPVQKTLGNKSLAGIDSFVLFVLVWFIRCFGHAWDCKAGSMRGMGKVAEPTRRPRGSTPRGYEFGGFGCIKKRPAWWQGRLRCYHGRWRGVGLLRRDDSCQLAVYSLAECGSFGWGERHIVRQVYRPQSDLAHRGYRCGECSWVGRNDAVWA